MASLACWMQLCRRTIPIEQLIRTFFQCVSFITTPWAIWWIFSTINFISVQISFEHRTEFCRTSLILAQEPENVENYQLLQDARHFCANQLVSTQRVKKDRFQQNSGFWIEQVDFDPFGGLTTQSVPRPAALFGQFLINLDGHILNHILPDEHLLGHL